MAASHSSERPRLKGNVEMPTRRCWPAASIRIATGDKRAVGADAIFSTRAGKLKEIIAIMTLSLGRVNSLERLRTQ
jgi:hypothetical protein